MLIRAEDVLADVVELDVFRRAGVELFLRLRQFAGDARALGLGRTRRNITLSTLQRRITGLETSMAALLSESDL